METGLKMPSWEYNFVGKMQRRKSHWCGGSVVAARKSIKIEPLNICLLGVWP